MRFFILILFLFYSTTIFSQGNSTQINGKVNSSDGKPLPHITVRVKGTAIGTTTKDDGSFQLPTRNQPIVLIFSGVGYKKLEKEFFPNNSTSEEIVVQLEESIKEFNDVLISASRKVENIDEVPSAITVVGQKTLQEQLRITTDITNVMQYTVPGLGFNTGRTSNTGQTLRGRQVLVLLDGIPQSTPLRNGGRDMRLIDPAAIERIEVIKGATAVYGNGADGGIINYITKPASAREGTRYSTTVGATSGLSSETHGFRFNQMISGGMDQVQYVVNASFERSGLAKSADEIPVSPFYNTGKMDTYNFLVKSIYSFASDKQIEGMYNFYKSASHLDYVEKTGVWGSVPTIGVKGSGSAPGTPQGTPYNHNATLKYRQQKIFFGTDLEAVAYLQSFRTVYGYDPQFFEGGGQSNIKSEKQGIRVNLNSSWNVSDLFRLDFYYGADILRDMTVQALQDGRNWTPTMNMSNVAPYLQAKLDIMGMAVLKTGFRFENLKVDVEDFTTIKTYNTTTKAYTDGGVQVAGGKLNYNAFVSNHGLKFNLFEPIQPFISYSQAFSINELGRILRTSQKSIVSQLETEPIIVNNLEGGFSGRLFDMIQYEYNYYNSTSELGASYKANATGTFEIQRAPEIVWGYEAIVDVYPVDFLSLGISYAFVEGKADADNNGSYESYLGGDRIASPKTTVSLTIRPITSLSITLNSLFAGSRNKFKPNASGVYAYGQGRVVAYEVFNLSGTYQFDAKLTLSFGIENLLDKDYYPAIAWWGSRASDFIKAPGRRVNISCNYNW